MTNHEFLKKCTTAFLDYVQQQLRAVSLKFSPDRLDNKEFPRMCPNMWDDFRRGKIHNFHITLEIHPTRLGKRRQLLFQNILKF